MTDPARAGKASGNSPFAPGMLLANRFRLKDLLRAEGETHLFRASDAQSGSDVALRVILIGGAGRAALERDLARAQQVAHKNLTALLGLASHNDHLLIASELEEGHTLRQIMDVQRSQGTPVGAERGYQILGHACSALEHAAAAGMAHGGLNPENISVNRGGRVKVAELGLAALLPALARRGGPPGSPGGLYLAPEVAHGQPATPASDVYSLGAILFELAAGVPPIPPLQPPSRLARGGSPAVDAVVGRALLPDPSGRFPHAREMQKALAAAVGAPDSIPQTPAPMTMPVVGGIARRTSGKAFNVAAAAGLSGSEARWLVQKDKLDFGPFSLQQVIAQIQQGVFRGDNLIVDMDSGARQKVKDHPQLGDIARDSERRLEQARRAQAEHATEHVERKKSRAFTFIIGAAVIGLAAGGGFFLYNRQAARQAALDARTEEAGIDAFIKQFKLEVSSSKRPTARRAGRVSGADKDDPFNSATNLGDVTQGGADEILDEGRIQGVMSTHYRKLVPCLMEERRRTPGLSDIDLEFVIRGDGRVSAVKVNGQRNGSLPGCVLDRMQSFSFPKYNGSKTIASWSMSLGR